MRGTEKNMKNTNTTATTNNTDGINISTWHDSLGISDNILSMQEAALLGNVTCKRM